MKAWRSWLELRGFTWASLGAFMPGIMMHGQFQQLWLDEAKAAKDSGLRFWVRQPQLSGVPDESE